MANPIIFTSPLWLVVTKNNDGINNYKVNAPNREEAMKLVRQSTMDKIMVVSKIEER